MFGALVPLALISQDAQYQEIPEEDEDLSAKTEYVFNPIQANKEMKVGDFYWKRGSFRAAAGRYEEATKWNPGFAEAFWKLGLAKEKLVEEETLEEKKKIEREEAAAAFAKYLEIESDGKRAKDAKQKIAELRGS